MPQFFSRKLNLLVPMLLLCGVIAATALVWLAFVANRGATDKVFASAPHQPVAFSHRHHAGEVGIDCRYCHMTVERSAHAGMPDTATCMGCHRYVWPEAPILQPVHESFRNNQPLKWRKITHLADFVYFDHSAHVLNGVKCDTCHGRIEEMSAMRQARSLSMARCLSCHRQHGRKLTECYVCHR